MAKEFPRLHQDLFVYAHKRNSNAIFCYPSSKQSCKSIKAIQWFAFCWLLAGLIGHPAQRGLLACTKAVGNKLAVLYLTTKVHYVQCVLYRTVKAFFAVNKALIA